MPIRFRCAYCNQLMGISARKAGTVVKCPKCAGEIIVPSPDVPQAEEESAQQGIAPSADQPAIAPASTDGPSEAKEFEDYFNEAANGPVGATAPTLNDPAPEPAAIPPSPPPPPPQRRGLLLTLPALVLCVIAMFSLLVLVFVLGVVIGRHSAPPPEPASQAVRPGPLAVEL